MKGQPVPHTSVEAMGELAPRPRAWGWLVYAAVAVAAAVVVTTWLPLWFRDDDAGFLLFAENHGLWESFSPDVGAVQTFYRPLFVAAFWLTYHAFGLTYAPYQAIQILVTFGIWAAFYAMLRNLWGNRLAALGATLLHAAIFSRFYYFTFRFSQLNYQLELLLGFTAVAVAASGWRRRCPGRLITAVVLTELAYLAKEPACVYLPLLHAWAAVVLGRRAGAKARTIALWLLAVVAVTAGHVWLVRTHFRLLAVGGQIAVDFDFIWTRLTYYARVLQGGIGGDLLAVLIGLAAACQVLRLRLRRSVGAVVGVAAFFAAATAAMFIHPILPVIAIAAAVPAAWPFAIGAVALIAAIAQLQPTWAMYIMQASWLMTAACVAAVLHSPLSQILAPLRDRLGRRGLVVLAALMLPIALALVVPRIRALRVVSDRRILARDLTRQHVLKLPPHATLAMPLWEDLGHTPQSIHALGFVNRARVHLQWPGKLYGQLLAACGRGDIRVIDHSDVRSPPVYLLATGTHERLAAMRLAAALTARGGTVETLAEVTRGVETGGLWRVDLRPTTAPSME